MIVAVTSDTGLLLLSVAGLAATASVIVRDTKRRVAPATRGMVPLGDTVPT